MRKMWLKIGCSFVTIFLILAGLLFWNSNRKENEMSSLRTERIGVKPDKTRNLFSGYTVEGRGPQHLKRGRRLEDKLVDLKFSGSVIAIDHSQLILKRGLNLADYSTDVYATSTTVYRSSIIQAMFSRAALYGIVHKTPTLAEDKVEKFVKTASPTLNSLTIRQLLKSDKSLELSTYTRNINSYSKLHKVIENKLRLSNSDSTLNQQAQAEAALFSYLIFKITNDENGIVNQIRDNVNLYDTIDDRYLSKGANLGGAFYLSDSDKYRHISHSRLKQVGINNLSSSVADIMNTSLEFLQESVNENQMRGQLFSQMQRKPLTIHANGLTIYLYVHPKTKTGFIAISNLQQTKKKEYKAQNALVKGISE